MTTTMPTTLAYDGPLGRLVLRAGPEGLAAIAFEDGDAPAASVRGDGVLCEAARQLDAYFAGDRRAFDLPLALAGTPFQLRVWGEVRRIPYGTTLSYRELARRIGRPAAVRAVGAANGATPVPIVIPCHRVVGSDGSLTGYGGGLDRKRALLELEGALETGASSTTPAGPPERHLLPEPFDLVGRERRRHAREPRVAHARGPAAEPRPAGERLRRAARAGGPPRHPVSSS
jgi:methylated-DNA-[protein]-cysteine S-methyltransferase